MRDKPGIEPAADDELMGRKLEEVDADLEQARRNAEAAAFLAPIVGAIAKLPHPEEVTFNGTYRGTPFHVAIGPHAATD